MTKDIDAGQQVDSVLALDLGTRMGWALSNGFGRISSGTNNFKPNRFDGGGMRYLLFERWLNLIHTTSPIKIVCFEEVRRHVGTDAAHIYGGFMGALTSWCEEREIPYQGIPVGTIKKFIAGKGNASKQDVIQAVKGRGFFPADDNEADAISLLLYVLSSQEIN